MAAVMAHQWDVFDLPGQHSGIMSRNDSLSSHDYQPRLASFDLPLDQYSNIDTESYMSNDEFDAHLTPFDQLHPRLLPSYSSAFEDPAADSAVSQIGPYSEGDVLLGHSDRQWLAFSVPSYSYILLDTHLRPTSLLISAQLKGGFFLSEPQWPGTPDTSAPPLELTCYRRNLFEIEGTITLPRILRYIMTDDGNRIPIHQTELSLSATESGDGNPVKIITIPLKAATESGTSKAEEKSEQEPANIPIDQLLAVQELETDNTQFRIEFKRLQFRVSTGNNGRRKDLQQHFLIKLKILATLSTGAKVTIAEVLSNPVIVRGRSPRNFQSRKDFAISSGSMSRRHPSIPRHSVSQTTVPQITSAPMRVNSPQEDPQMNPSSYGSTQLQAIGPEPPQIASSYASSQMQGISPDFAAWHQQIPTSDVLMTQSYPPSGMPNQAQSQPPGPSHGLPLSMMPALSNVAAMNNQMNLNFNSDDEGSPLLQTIRRRSRGPTSNPSMENARPATFANSASPSRSGVHSPKRSRLHSQASSMAYAPVSRAASSPVAPASTSALPPGLPNLPQAYLDTFLSEDENGPNSDYQYIPVEGEGAPYPDQGFLDGTYSPFLEGHSSMDSARRDLEKRALKRSYSDTE